MQKSPQVLAVLATGLVAVLHAAPTGTLAATKVWVANTGVDSMSCGSIASPCATFQQAFNNVAAGGEIGVLNPGDYGPVQVSKAVDIINDGVGEAGIQAPGTSAVSIAAANGDIIAVRGLVLDGLGTGVNGIAFTSGSALHVQNCVIKNFEGVPFGFGIGFAPSAGNSQMFVSDSIIFNNGSINGTAGIAISPGAFSAGIGSANVVIDRVHLENNVDGLLLDGNVDVANGSHVTIRDSVISGNAANGIHALTVANRAPALAIVERSSILDNAGNGILADGPRAVILLSDSTISRNGAGVTTVNSGQLITYGNNRNNNNLGPEGTATSTLGLF